MPRAPLIDVQASPGAQWSPLAWDGRKAWSRRLRVNGKDDRLLLLAVWEDGVGDGWEWELFDERTDQHLAGGSGETARGALDAAIALVDGAVQFAP